MMPLDDVAQVDAVEFVAAAVDVGKGGGFRFEPTMPTDLRQFWVFIDTDADKFLIFEPPQERTRAASDIEHPFTAVKEPGDRHQHIPLEGLHLGDIEKGEFGTIFEQPRPLFLRSL